MKDFILATVIGLMPACASAGFVAADLEAYYLPDCVVQGEGSHPGPINPRVAAPSDAAPWLINREWDVRPYDVCKNEKVINHKTPHVKHKHKHKNKKVIKGPALPPQK